MFQSLWYVGQEKLNLYCHMHTVKKKARESGSKGRVSVKCGGGESSGVRVFYPLFLHPTPLHLVPLVLRWRPFLSPFSLSADQLIQKMQTKKWRAVNSLDQPGLCKFLRVFFFLCLNIHKLFWHCSICVQVGLKLKVSIHTRELMRNASSRSRKLLCTWMALWQYPRMKMVRCTSTFIPSVCSFRQLSWP